MANEVVKWLLEKRVMFVSADGEQNQAQFNFMNDEMFRLLDEGQVPVHAILDMSKLTKPYFDISTISRKSVGNDKRIGQMMLIGATGTTRFLINVIGAIVKSNYHNVNSLEEAKALLREKDNTIVLP